MKGCILLLGGSNNAGRIVAKQLYEAGFTVEVIEWEMLALAKSKFIRQYHLVHNPQISVIQCVNDIMQLLAEKRYELMIPVHDPAMELCAHFQQQFNTLTKTAFPNSIETYEFAHNKWKLLKHAEEFGLKIPASKLITSIGDWEKARNELTGELVIKPIYSNLILNNRMRTFAVEFPENIAQTEDKIRELINSTPALLQQKVAGFGIGFNIIAKNGEIINAYIHKRLFQIGTVSTYRESMLPNMWGLEEKLRLLIKKTGWTGVAMIEFKVDETGVAYLMEMNGRFFGSLAVAMYGGLNYPQQFIAAVKGEHIPCQSVIPGIKVRFFHDELFYHARNIKTKPLFFFRWLGTVAYSVFLRNHYIEDNVWNDPSFVIALYRQQLKRIFKKYAVQNPAKKTHIAVISSAEADARITMVCYGNICRSPFAELYLKKIRPDLDVSGAGISPEEYRLPPVLAVEAAREYGIESAGYLSGTITAGNVETDLYVVMDKSNAFDLVELGIPLTKIRMLDDQPVPDPYQQDIGIFRLCFAQIVAAINRVWQKTDEQKNSQPPA
jgi:protein-tyrosine-phosphatase/predicted ATP-grasp superfamily ATP-dependent carboligase